MLWWVVGLWLLSPALLPIFWLLGMLASSGGSELSRPTDKTPATIGAFAASARPAASRQVRGMIQVRSSRGTSDRAGRATPGSWS